MHLATSRKRGATPHPTITHQVSESDTANGHDTDASENPLLSLQIDTDSAPCRSTPAGQLHSRWLTPRTIFLVISMLFCSTWALACRYQWSKLDIASINSLPCNPSGRVLATCAHRANAAELLIAATGSSSSRRASISSTKDNSLTPPLLKQITMLWEAGITCFDLDVVQLSGGELVVGHPADLVQLSRQSSSSSSSNKRSATLVAGLLHDHSLSELRAAGVTADAAPLLDGVLRHFADLRKTQPVSQQTRNSISDSSDAFSSMSAIQAVSDRTNWQRVPMLGLELKGQAAVQLPAWQQIVNLAQSAAVADAIILLLRQQTSTSSSSSNEYTTLLQLAGGIKQTAIKAAGAARPLLALIMPDSLMQQQQQPKATSNSSMLAQSMLLQAAGASSVLVDNSKETEAATTGANQAGAVLDTFDFLAPSIKLPMRVLAELVHMKPAFTWTLESQEDVRKAMWLGLDVGSHSKPMQQKLQVQQSHDKLCSPS